jgi:uncharacterized protein
MQPQFNPQFKTRFKRWKFFCLGIMVFLGLFYISVIEPNWIEVKQVSLNLPHLDRAFENYKIVQVTDVHADEWMNHDRLAQIVQRVNHQNPDLVALTGDYISRRAERYAPILEELNQLQAPDGAFAVLGNHDQWTNPQLVRQILQRSGVAVLRNQVQPIQRGDASLNIAGVGDVLTHDDDLNQVLRQMPETGMGVMLAHEPDFADATAATERFDLQLSGHSHGGQIKIPFVKKRALPPLSKKYPIGLYQIGDLQEYTSRGVGVAHGLRFRFNCRPEITVFTLHQTPA